jgi:hypothetical protein
MAFVFAGGVALATVALCALMVMAEMSKPIPGSGAGVLWTFGGGMAIAALIAVSHWFHWSW